MMLNLVRTPCRPLGSPVRSSYVPGWGRSPPRRTRKPCIRRQRDRYGEGIAPEHLEKLFIPFFTTKREGTGLGLAICRRMVEAHGGEIAVQSKRGEGSTFTMRFPLTVPEGDPDQTLS